MIFNFNGVGYDITDEIYDEILDSRTFQIIDGEIILDDNSLELKKNECRAKIEEHYKEHDQINIIARGTQTEIDNMNTYIGGVLAEFDTNGKDANFDSIVVV